MAGAEVPVLVRVGLAPKSPESWPDSSFCSSQLAPGGPSWADHCSHFPDGETEALLKDLGPWLVTEG